MKEKRDQRKTSGHGSLSKSGKVRMQSQPIVWRDKKFRGKKHKIPRIANRIKFIKLLNRREKKYESRIR